MLLPEIEVSFLLNNDEEDYTEIISSSLNIEPSKIRKKDSFEHQEFAHNMWELSSGKVHCKAISIPFSKVLALLIGKEEVIKKIMKENNIRSKFVVVLHAEIGDGPEVSLTRDIIRFADSVDAEIDFDLYYY